MVDIEKLADEYFSSLNFTSRSIMRDKANFESLLGGQWSSLPSDEQESLLDEHFIPPQIQQKYVIQSDDADLPQLFPHLKIKSGQKIVEDDEGETWQDEHSGPFSWETSSQSEFSVNEDMSSMESVKIRLKDPKRPKSPRLMKVSTSGDAPRPGTLERTGSTDFQQLRHLWEAHHAITPDGELPPMSFLSRSQNSLDNIDVGKTEKTNELENEKLELSVPEGNTQGTLPVNPSTVTLKSFNLDTDKQTDKLLTEIDKDQTQESANRKEPSPPVAAGPTAAAPLAVREDDADLTFTDRQDNSKQAAMNEDIEKMDEIKDKMQAIASKQDNQPSSTQKKPANQEDDILKRFGVKFSYGDEEPPPPTGSDIMATAALGSMTRKTNTKHEKVENKDADSSVSPPAEAEATGSAALPTGFDFLTGW